MKKVVFLFLILLYSISHGQNNLNIDSTKIVTPEGIGQYLSSLLIKRGDFKKSKVAIDINVLFPDKDSSDFKDSPAEFIFSIFKGYQALLPKSWDSLLYDADTFNLNESANYVKTFFYKTSKDKYKCIAALKYSKKFYALTFEVLIWQKDYYVLAVNNKLCVFGSMDKLLTDYSKKLFDIEEMVANSEGNLYPYNYDVKLKIKNTTIPSYDKFAEKLTRHIKEMKSYSKLILEETGTYGTELDEHWIELISFIQKNEYTNLKCYQIFINNISYEDTGRYNLFLIFRFSSKKKTYTFSCLSKLFDDDWYLTDVSAVNEVPKIKFK